MHVDFLLARDCVQCPSSPPVCDCDSTQSCFQIAQCVLWCIVSVFFFSSCTFRSCTQCSSFKCVDQPTPSNPSHGVSAGAIAGAVIGALVFLGLAVGLFLWWRHRNATPIEPAVPEVKDIPAPADTVLNRPDPSEKISSTPEPVPTEPVVRVYGNSTSTIDLDPTPRSALSRRGSAQSNPFGDSHSIQTTSTGSQSTNVIPIAFVPPPASVFPSGSKFTLLPMPGSDLNMDHMNLSVESVPANFSDRSGISVIADDRSYITNASYASDVLTEVPTIITGRQVVSAAKGAVVPANARSLASRPSIRSPLAASTFGPQDVLREADEDHPLPVPADPFADRRPPPMVTQGISHTHTDWNTAPTELPWNADPDFNDSDRPLSTFTQAASVIGADIIGATRVHLGFALPASADLDPNTPMASSVGSARALVRVASGRLVTPHSTSHFERQQQRALLNAEQVQQVDKGQAISQRMSMSTMASGVSGRADSILESFTFVPPSPISNRPLRTPPRSPLAQETPNVSSRPSPAPVEDDGDLEPPNRQILGMSTGSQFSSISTGLGSFPFQIDHGNDGGLSGEPEADVLPNGKPSKTRASLDTLVLTKDLSSYPLGFDRQSNDSFSPYQERRS